MFTTADEYFLQKKGITIQQIAEQLNYFKTGFPFLKIESAASIKNGILKVSDHEKEIYSKVWNNYLNSGDFTVMKFVPASGAASRMFKDLFEFLDKESSLPSTNFEKLFFDNIEKFAFYEDLNNVCKSNEGQDIKTLKSEEKYKAIIQNLLLENGLNYGSLPKGLLKFHSYPSEKRTPVQEQLVEATLYSTNHSGVSNLHFTVSGEHRSLFEAHLEAVKKEYEKRYNVQFNIGFSEQKPSTDTVAADADNQPFRDNENLVFRPGGHGALIENLNDIDADVIFIKNIDNVVTDRLKAPTVEYKNLIAGILVHFQQQTFAYLKELKKEEISEAKLSVIAQFCDVKLNNHHPKGKSLRGNELREYLIRKLNRPIRVCGMVKNAGEPGGGPFLTVNTDGTISPQILESSQIHNSEKDKIANSTHFNPVDLVCGIKDYNGKKFNLLDFVDKNTGFISIKSKNGKELKALELPGLWNGAMSDWNTIFVEVPIETFNPVKTINDLLRKEHQ